MLLNHNKGELMEHIMSNGLAICISQWCFCRSTTLDAAYIIDLVGKNIISMKNDVESYGFQLDVLRIKFKDPQKSPLLIRGLTLNQEREIYAILE